MTLGLGNMRALLEALGHPEKGFRSVVIAGTNGKGSVTACLSAILEENGTRVGRYTSPHLYSVTERICIDNAPVALEVMEEAAARIVPLHESIGYSYFEALTAIAFLVFAESGIEVAVLETGLGGRFDATNVVDPVLCILTSIGLDHRRILGDSEEEIVREKLGITRPETPLLVGELSEDLLAIVREKARRDGFPVFTGTDIGKIESLEMSFEGMSATVHTENAEYGTVILPFSGAHQLGNALLAIGAAERLLSSAVHLERAAELAFLPGRFEVLTFGRKRIILDVAHNDSSLVATAATLAALSPPGGNGLVLGMLDRKELTEFPRSLEKWFHRLHLVEPVPGESLAATAMLGRIGMPNLEGHGIDVIVERPFENEGEWMEFFGRLLNDANPIDAFLVTGSHRTVEVAGRGLAGVN
jgi:dihydrofolate synthase/folylpolyglutamate synthase